MNGNRFSKTRLRAIVLTSDTRDHECIDIFQLTDTQRELLDAIYLRVFGLDFAGYQSYVAELKAELNKTCPSVPAQPLLSREMTAEEDKAFHEENPQFFERLSRQSSGVPTWFPSTLTTKE